MLKYDVLILGGGVAGIEAAKYLSRYDKKVALVERDRMGGVALLWGGLPMKRVVSFYEENYDPSRKEEFLDLWEAELDRLHKIILKDLEYFNIDRFYGDGEFLDESHYKIADEIIQADKIIIATGTDHKDSHGLVSDGKKVLNHKHLLDLSDIPESITMVSRGFEAIEIGSVYLRLGSKVNIIDSEGLIFKNTDYDLISPIKNRIRSLGGNIIMDQKIESIEEGDMMRVKLSDGRILESEKIMLTAERKANIPRGLERAGVNYEEDFIPVTGSLKTSNKNIYAIGDINGILSMTHIAMNEGIYVSREILGQDNKRLDYSIIPRAIFANPSIAGVGKQERDCKLLGIKYSVGYCNLSETGRGWSLGIDKGFIKVIIDIAGRIIGIWVSGQDITDHIGFLAYLIENEITVNELSQILIINPSMMEGIKMAAVRATIK